MKWERRKGWDILFEAFLKEFSKEAAVLYVLSYTHARIPHFQSSRKHNLTIFQFPGSVIKSDIEKWIKHEVRGITEEFFRQKIVIIEARFDYKQLPCIYKEFDAFVLLSKGEGWGRPYLEALAMSIPVNFPYFRSNCPFN